MTGIQVKYFVCFSALIIQGISANPTADAPAGLNNAQEEKKICGVPSCSSELCEVKGEADKSCKTIAESVGATDPSCCDQNVCSFTIPSTKCSVAVTKNSTVPTSVPTAAPNNTTNSGVHYCGDNGLVIISDVQKVCSAPSSDSTPSGPAGTSTTPLNPTGTNTTGSKPTGSPGTGPTSTDPSGTGSTPTGSPGTGSTPTVSSGTGSTPTGSPGTGSTPTGSPGTGPTSIDPSGTGSTPTGSPGTGPTSTDPSGTGSTPTVSSGTGSTPTGSPGTGSTPTGSSGTGSTPTVSSGTGSTPTGSPGTGPTSTSTTIGAYPKESTDLYGATTPAGRSPLDQPDQGKLCALPKPVCLCTTPTENAPDDACKNIATAIGATNPKCSAINTCEVTYKGKPLSVSNNAVPDPVKYCCESNGLTAFCK